MVDIRVDLETLTGLTENPGELAGFGPVIADIARRVTAEQESAEWRWTVVDDNNQVVHTGITTRRPITALKRHVQACFRCCVFPGCRVPAADCDLDHTVAVSDGGPTTISAPIATSITYRLGWTYHSQRRILLRTGGIP